MAQNPTDLGKRGSDSPVLLNLSPVPYKAVWKQDAEILECAEEHGFETPWASVGPDKVRVILAVTKVK